MHWNVWPKAFEPDQTSARVRQQILEGLGWKLHRIWSTDWWHDAEGEMAKLKVVLEEARDRPEEMY